MANETTANSAGACMMVRSPKPERIKDLNNFLIELEAKARRLGFVFKRDCLPGSKRDFQKVLRARVASFEEVSESVIENSLGLLNCKFPNGGNICAQDKTMRTLYPEHFAQSNLHRTKQIFDY